MLSVAIPCFLVEIIETKPSVTQDNWAHISFQFRRNGVRACYLNENSRVAVGMIGESVHYNRLKTGIYGCILRQVVRACMMYVFSMKL